MAFHSINYRSAKVLQRASFDIIDCTDCGDHVICLLVPNADSAHGRHFKMLGKQITSSDIHMQVGSIWNYTHVLSLRGFWLICSIIRHVYVELAIANLFPVKYIISLLSTMGSSEEHKSHRHKHSKHSHGTTKRSHGHKKGSKHKHHKSHHRHKHHRKSHKKDHNPDVESEV